MLELLPIFIVYSLIVIYAYYVFLPCLVVSVLTYVAAKYSFKVNAPFILSLIIFGIISLLGTLLAAGIIFVSAGVPYHPDCKNQSDKLTCTSAAAVEKNDVSICEKTYADKKWESKLEYCLLYFAHKTLNDAACDKIPEESRISNCHYEVAFKNAVLRNDVSICQTYFKDNDKELQVCYSRFANETNNDAACENLSAWPRSRDWCYSDFATRKKDASLCENISDTALKEKCRSRR
jgi:hypothetical protein